MATPLKELVSFLDAELHAAEVPDSANAVNGLQLEASTSVSRVALAVDATEPVIDEAARRGAQLLLVHHGLFWSGLKPLTGPLGRKVGRCFGAGLSLYSAHAPLDLHPELGNNAGLMRALGLSSEGCFAPYHGKPIGLLAACDLSIEELEQRVRAAVGPCRRMGRGPARVKRLGVISGGAGGFITEAAEAGLDALLTGEGAHHTVLEAEERGMHLLFAGHYRTETFGVRALGQRLAERFGLETFFVEHETGS